MVVLESELKSDSPSGDMNQTYEVPVKVPERKEINNHLHIQQTVSVGQLCSRFSVWTDDCLLPTDPKKPELNIDPQNENTLVITRNRLWEQICDPNFNSLFPPTGCAILDQSQLLWARFLIPYPPHRTFMGPTWHNSGKHLIKCLAQSKCSEKS